MGADEIQTNAQNPKSGRRGAQSFDNYSISEQIMADRYAKSQDAASKGRLGIRLHKLKSPGATE